MYLYLIKNLHSEYFARIDFSINENIIYLIVYLESILNMKIDISSMVSWK